MFFDEANIGYTTLAQILEAFRTKVEVKVPIGQAFFIAVNTIVEYENLVYAETMRLYSMYEDPFVKGVKIENLDVIFNKIAYNSLNVYKAIAETKDVKKDNPIDCEEFETIVRKYNLFEESDYLNEVYEQFRKIHQITYRCYIERRPRKWIKWRRTKNLSVS
jgi:hypothetical protein